MESLRTMMSFLEWDDAKAYPLPTEREREREKESAMREKKRRET